MHATFRLALRRRVLGVDRFLFFRGPDDYPLLRRISLIDKVREQPIHDRPVIGLETTLLDAPKQRAKLGQCWFDAFSHVSSSACDRLQTSKEHV
jgi:hypothetical protein